MSERDTGLAARHLHDALTAQQRGDLPAAHTAALAALDAFSEAEDRTGSAAAHHLLFMTTASMGQLDKADEHLAAAAALRESTGDTDGIASLYQQRFGLSLQRGDSAAARASSEKVLAVYESVGDRENQAAAIHQFVQFLIQEADLTRARELLDKGMWLTDRAGEERGRSALTLLMSQLEFAGGNVPRGVSLVEDAVSIARKAGKRPALIDAQHQLGVTYAMIGRLEDALALLEEVLDGRELMRDLEGRANTLRELAGVEAALGLTREALGRLDYAGRTYKEMGNIGGQATALHAASTLAEEAEQIQDALRFGQALIDVCEEMKDPEASGSARFAQGARHVMVGDLESAAACYRSAAADQRSVGAMESRGISLGMLGQVLDELGDREGADKALSEAVAQLEAVNSTSLADLQAILAQIRSS